MEATVLPDVAVQGEDSGVAGLLVEAIHVLRDDGETGLLAFQLDEGVVSCIRLAIPQGAATFLVKTPDERGVGSEGFRRGQFLGIVLRPEAGEGIAEGGDAGLGAHAGAGEDDEAAGALEGGEGLLFRVRHGGGKRLTFRGVEIKQ